MTQQPTSLRPEDAVAAIGIDGPLLVVAAAGTVAGFAPAWAAAGPRRRGGYRVLVVREAGPDEPRQIVAEAISFAAAAIVAVGSEAVIAAAATAAAELDLPLTAVRLGSVNG